MKSSLKITLGVLAYFCAIAILAVLASLREEFGWLLALFVFASVFAFRRWARLWRRRTFDPVTAQDRERSLDRQILQAKLIVGVLVGIGALLALAAVIERLGA